VLEEKEDPPLQVKNANPQEGKVGANQAPVEDNDNDNEVEEEVGEEEQVEEKEEEEEEEEAIEEEVKAVRPKVAGPVVVQDWDEVAQMQLAIAMVEGPPKVVTHLMQRVVVKRGG
jgi:hypothetical protein